MVSVNYLVVYLRFPKCADLPGRAQTLLSHMDERGVPKSGRLFAAVARAVLDMETPRLQSFFDELRHARPTSPPPLRTAAAVTSDGVDNADQLGLDLAVHVLAEAQASGRYNTHMAVQVRMMAAF